MIGGFKESFMKSSTLFFFVLVLSLVSCSKVKKLDKSLDRIQDLSKNTETLSTNTEDTGTMYRQLRTKEARSTRVQEIDNFMKKDTLIESKITSAGVYFKAMEYQLATEQELLNDPETMRALKDDAANDFIRIAGDLYSEIKLKNVDPTKDLEKHNKEAVFIALATSMHLNHHHQEALASKNRIATVSLYDIIKNALRKEKADKDARANGNKNPEFSFASYEQILISGVRKEICIELIKARVDMLSAIALKFMTDKRDMSLSQFLKGLSFKVTFGHSGSIELPLTINDADSATKQTAFDALEGALKAKRFLNNEIAVEKKLNKTLKSAFEHIKLQADGDRQLEKISKQIEELLN